MYLYFLYSTVRSKCVDSCALSYNIQKNGFLLLYQYSQQPISKVQDLFAFFSVLIFHYGHTFRIWIQKLFAYIFFGPLCYFYQYDISFISLISLFACMISFISLISLFACMLKFCFKIFFFFFEYVKLCMVQMSTFDQKLFKEVPLCRTLIPIIIHPLLQTFAVFFWFILHMFSKKN